VKGLCRGRHDTYCHYFVRAHLRQFGQGSNYLWLFGDEVNLSCGLMGMCDRSELIEEGDFPQRRRIAMCLIGRSAGADLAKSNLSSALLNGSNLTGASLAFSNLTYAEFNRANLAVSYLRKILNLGLPIKPANLTAASIAFSDVSYADFTDARAVGLKGILQVTGDTGTKGLKGLPLLRR
jgi:hypothetical protein